MTIHIYPTDTLWGIGCNIYDEEAVDLIGKIKGSLPGKPQSILFDEIKSVRNYFSIPEQMTNEWLTQFFMLETTMLIPLNVSLKEIPSWITCESECVGVRLVSNVAINKIIKREKKPIVTTSLNLSGRAAIVKEEDARRFWQQYCPYACIYKSEQALSGHPSSIVQMDGSFIRRGFFDKKIEDHFGLLPA